MSAKPDMRVGDTTLDRLDRLATLFAEAKERLVSADIAFDDATTEAAFALIDGGDPEALLDAAETAYAELVDGETKVRRLGLLVARLAARISRSVGTAAPVSERVR